MRLAPDVRTALAGLFAAAHRGRRSAPLDLATLRAAGIDLLRCGPDENGAAPPAADGGEVALRPPEPERRLVIAVGQDRGQGLARERSELKALLHDWTPPDQPETAVLLMSELVADVMVHTDQPAELTATVTGEPGERTLRVEVTDRSHVLPHRHRTGELPSSGRGIMLLDSLCDRWSARPEAHGKTVWFVLHESAGSDQE